MAQWALIMYNKRPKRMTLPLILLPTGSQQELQTQLTTRAQPGGSVEETIPIPPTLSALPTPGGVEALTNSQAVIQRPCEALRYILQATVAQLCHSSHGVTQPFAAQPMTRA